MLRKIQIKKGLIHLFSKNVLNLVEQESKKLILNNKLKIDGKIINAPSKKIRKGDNIFLEIPEPKTSLKPFNFDLDIIYQDDDLIVINKPAGISMHPGPGNYDNTVVNALMNYKKIKLSSIGDELRPGIIHRIDKDTSGLVVIAKNNLSHQNISKQFSDHSIDRFITLCVGKIKTSVRCY